MKTLQVLQTRMDWRGENRAVCVLGDCPLSPVGHPGNSCTALASDRAPSPASTLSPQFLRRVEGKYTQEHFFERRQMFPLTIISVECFPRWLSGKEPPCQCRRHRRRGSIPGVRKIPWRRKWLPTQYSCLENPMDRGAWQAIQSIGSQRLGHD